MAPTPAGTRRPVDRRRSTSLFALLALTLGLAAPAAAAQPAQTAVTPAASAVADKSYDRELFLDSGHVDAFNVTLVDGVPTLNLKEDVTGSHVQRAPEDVELHVKEEARIDFPAVAALPEALHGTSGYYLPLSQDYNLLWPGWDSLGLGGSSYDVPVKIHVSDVEGPGEVFLWSSGAFGNLVPLLDGGDVQLPGTITQTLLAHVHANWVFTEPGDYWFTVSAEVLDEATGEMVGTNSARYLFSVGDFDRVPETVTVSAPAAVYATGDVVELTAAQYPDVADVAWSWQSAVPGGEWATVEGQTTSTYTGTADVDGEQLRAVVTVGETSVVSEPVALSVQEPEPELPTTLTVDGLANPYEQGATVTLAATPDLIVEGATYRWESSTDDGATWSAVEGQTGAIYAGTADTDGEQLRATVVIDGTDVVTSTPVTVEVTPAPEPEPEPTDPEPSPEPTDPEPSPEPGQCWDTRIDRGHVDAFYLSMVDGAPTLALKDDTVSPHEIRRPEDVELHVKEAARVELPAVAAIPPQLQRETVHHLPLAQNQDLLWPGWESQPLAGHYDTVEIDVSEVDGPGEVLMWTNGSFGQVGSLLADGGYALPGTIEQDFLAHAHANWAFTEPGAYYLTVSATVSSSGAERTTNTGRYLFTVGEDLPADYRDCVQVPTTAPQAPADDELTHDNRGGVTLDRDQVRAGEQVVVSAPSLGDGYAAAFLHSEPVAATNGWVQADDGTFVATIPASAAFGAHRLSVVDAENELVGWAGVTVLAAAEPTPDPEPSPDPAPTPDPGPGTPKPRPTPGPATPGGNGTGGAPQCFPVPGVTGGSGQSTSGRQTGGSSAPADVTYGTEGHFDFGPAVVNGSFTMQVKDDRTAPPVWRDPSDVVFVLDDEHARREADSVPAELAFIAPEGQDVWMIQQVQEPGVPWLGFNTQHETVVNGPGADGVELRLESVEGPGELAVFLNGTFGDLVGQRVVDSVGGPTTYTIPANTHQHGNWVFTEAGDYAVTFTLSADGESVTDTLRFSVGQDDPSTAAPTAATTTTATMTTTGDAASDEDAPRPGWGVTASGEPCRLAQTGADVAPLGAALASLVLGTVAVLVSRRIRARA
ncbi:TIGR03773 family transporter-associated surface protein [Georgenia satyanarayanai]|uniref:TIGR03773 family transporter-associated surface protein n=1 Tax=Georgenia satyanarayanai TaxID=860221 RepID=UPI00186B2E5D|nr:TIGR03773 family transporter-associated surface protein [Georgenia satyanarayanai]